MPRVGLSSVHHHPDQAIHRLLPLLPAVRDEVTRKRQSLDRAAPPCGGGLAYGDARPKRTPVERGRRDDGGRRAAAAAATLQRQVTVLLRYRRNGGGTAAIDRTAAGDGAGILKNSDE